MFDTTLTLSTAQTATINALLLDTYGKRIYRELQPRNVTRRFAETKAELIALAKHDTGQPICELANRMQDSEKQWPPGCTLRRLRQFELIARHGRCDLTQRGFDPDQFVPELLIALSRRLRTYQHTLN